MTSVHMSETTELLTRIDDDPDTARELTIRLYDELHRLAGVYMRRERKDHTLQTTAVEAYLRLVGQREFTWPLFEPNNPRS